MSSSETIKFFGYYIPIMSDLLAEKILFDNEEVGVEEVPENPERHPDGSKVKEENKEKINVGDVNNCGKYEFI